MGIKNLHSFLRSKAHPIYKTISLDNLQETKIAIDTSIYMCRYKSSMATKWLQGFWNLIQYLGQKKITPLFVFDSQAPPEKDLEKQQRREAKSKTVEKIIQLNKEWEKYIEKNISFDKQTFQNSIADFPTLSRVLSNRSFETIEDVVSYLVKIENAQTKICQEDFELLRNLFDLCGINYIIAPSEAEAACAYLNRNGTVDGVLTEDTDVLAYRTPTMYYNFNYRKNTVDVIQTSEILKELSLSAETFLDFTICCGTDYNKNMKKIGPHRAYELLRKHGRIEHIPDLDTSCLNFERVRELFNPVYEDLEVKWNAISNINELNLFCFRNNLRWNNSIRSMFESANKVENQLLIKLNI